MINETEENLRLTGGAVHFQSQYATQQLGALRYVSTGMVTSDLQHHASFWMRSHLWLPMEHSHSNE